MKPAAKDNLTILVLNLLLVLSLILGSFLGGWWWLLFGLLATVCATIEGLGIKLALTDSFPCYFG